VILGLLRARLLSAEPRSNRGVDGGKRQQRNRADQAGRLCLYTATDRHESSCQSSCNPPSSRVAVSNSFIAEELGRMISSIQVSLMVADIFCPQFDARAMPECRGSDWARNSIVAKFSDFNLRMAKLFFFVGDSLLSQCRTRPEFRAHDQYSSDRSACSVWSSIPLLSSRDNHLRHGYVSPNKLARLLNEYKTVQTNEMLLGCG
jgi:hypothetical protein